MSVVCEGGIGAAYVGVVSDVCNVIPVVCMFVIWVNIWYVVGVDSVCMWGCLIYVDVDGFMCLLCVYHVTNMGMLCYCVHIHILYIHCIL